MRNLIVMLAMVGLLAATASADWGHPVKWDQMSGGFDDVAAASWIDYDTPSDALTADDFLCTETGYITEIEFAGFSYYGFDCIDAFRVSFWRDVPANPVDASHPGDLLHEVYVDPADEDGIGWQGDALAGAFLINLPKDMWFEQQAGNVYWIGIQGVMITDTYYDAFYWRFANRQAPTWNDDAAFMSVYGGIAPWASWGLDPTGATTFYDGTLPQDWTSLDMAFALHGVPVPEPGMISLIGLSGLGALALYRRRK